MATATMSSTSFQASTLPEDKYRGAVVEVNLELLRLVQGLFNYFHGFSGSAITARIFSSVK